MNPTELHDLFSAKEQTLLVSTEPARLKGMSEDQLDELFTRVRRERNKYSTLYRRQSSASVDAASSRAGTSTSNQRTRRKAEIFEDTLARVARALSVAARASANELKRERLQAATTAKSRPPAKATAIPAAVPPTGLNQRGRTAKGGAANPSRRASSASQGASRQARSDAR